MPGALRRQCRDRWPPVQWLEFAAKPGLQKSDGPAWIPPFSPTEELPGCAPRAAPRTRVQTPMPAAPPLSDLYRLLRPAPERCRRWLPRAPCSAGGPAPGRDADVGPPPARLLSCELAAPADAMSS